MANSEGNLTPAGTNPGPTPLEVAARQVAGGRRTGATAPTLPMEVPADKKGALDTTEAARRPASGIPNLAQRIAAVMAEVEPLAKGAKNSGLGYAFVSVEQMIPMVRPLMAKHGIAVFPRVRTAEYEAGTTRSGGPLTICHVIVDWTVTDGFTSEPASTPGEAFDTSDKSTSKAMTAAYKQLLAKLFHLNSDEDNDTQHIERGQWQQREPATARQQPKQSGNSPAGSEWGVCPRHGVEFFQTAKMERPAHKPTDGGKWCDEPAMKKQYRDIANLSLGKMFPADLADRGDQLNDWLEGHLPLIAEIDPGARTASDWAAIADAARESGNVQAPAQDDETPW